MKIFRSQVKNQEEKNTKESNICNTLLVKVCKTFYLWFFDQETLEIKSRGVVVITSASHAEGLGFEPRRDYFFFFVLFQRIADISGKEKDICVHNYLLYLYTKHSDEGPLLRLKIMNFQMS